MKEIHELVEHYLQYLTEVRNLSTRTTVSYKQDLIKFQNFLQIHGIDIQNSDKQIIRAFFGELQRERLSSSTVNRIISALKGFFSYLVRYEYIQKNPVERVKSIKGSRKLPSVLTLEEVHLLLNAPDNSFQGIRDASLFQIFYSTGCRLSELTAMNENDLDIDKGFILVHGKGNKDRFVYLTEPAKAVLKQYLSLKYTYLQTDKVYMNEKKALIINTRGKRITAQGVHYIFKKYTDQLQLNKHITPHTLRHTFATHILDNDAGIRVVQELLGHENISTTQIYSHVGIERLKKVYEQTHPHGRRKK